MRYANHNSPFLLYRYEINTDNLAEAAAKATAANTAPGVSGTNNTAEEAVKLILDSPYKHIHAIQQISKKIKRTPYCNPIWYR